MAAWASRGGSSNKHSFADTEIEITTKTSLTAILFSRWWKIHVVAIMRPRRPLSRLLRKTATDIADIVLEVDFPEDGGEGVVGITEARRSSGSVSAIYSYERNPWHPGDREWWQIWRTQNCVIRYCIQVEYLGNPYTFSGDLQVFEPSTGGGGSM